MDSTFGGGGFTQTGVEAKRESKSEGTVPMFIKQILDQKDNVVKFWGFEYKMITTVAIVRSISHSSTKITYDLEDITGKITAHLWVEEADAPSSSNGINVNTYARVIGSVRQTGDEKLIMVFKIHPVAGINEVNTHYLEVVNARYEAEAFCRSNGDGTNNDKMEVDNGSLQLNTQGAMKDGKTQAVYKAIQASAGTNPDRGINRTELKRTFAHINDNEMSKIIDGLLEDGHIYSTVDSDHFLACF